MNINCSNVLTSGCLGGFLKEGRGCECVNLFLLFLLFFPTFFLLPEKKKRMSTLCQFFHSIFWAIIYSVLFFCAMRIFSVDCNTLEYLLVWNWKQCKLGSGKNLMLRNLGNCAAQAAPIPIGEEVAMVSPQVLIVPNQATPPSW